VAQWVTLSQDGQQLAKQSAMVQPSIKAEHACPTRAMAKNFLVDHAPATVLLGCRAVVLQRGLPDFPRRVDVHGGNGQPHNHVRPYRGARNRPSLGRRR
jgi:hypothetical protein